MRAYSKPNDGCSVATTGQTFKRWEVAIFAIGASVTLLMLVLMAITARRGVIEYEKEAYRNGAAAYESGVPPTANPHKGSQGQRWLDGWIEASKAAKQ